MKIGKVIAIDTAYAERAAQGMFPVARLARLVASAPGVDVLETLATVVQRVPEDDSAEKVAEAASQAIRKRHALESSGCRTILAPAKRSQATTSGFKHSDDQRLMIETLLTCMRLRPDFLTLVAADGDYAPLVWGLRKEGIRTEVVAGAESLASDLRRAAVSVIDLGEVLERIRSEDSEDEEGGNHGSAQ